MTKWLKHTNGRWHAYTHYTGKDSLSVCGNIRAHRDADKEHPDGDVCKSCLRVLGVTSLFDVKIGHNEVDGIGWVTHIRVNRSDGRGGITWDALQLVKSEAGYSNSTAIEIYPPDDEVVNETNMRHLWILPESFVLPSLFKR